MYRDTRTSLRQDASKNTRLAGQCLACTTAFAGAFTAAAAIPEDSNIKTALLAVSGIGIAASFLSASIYGGMATGDYLTALTIK